MRSRVLNVSHFFGTMFRVLFLLAVLLPSAFFDARVSVAVETYPDFADIIIHVEVGLSQEPKDFYGLTEFLTAVLNTFPIGEENAKKTRICVHLDNGRDNSPWYIRQNLEKEYHVTLIDMSIRALPGGRGGQNPLRTNCTNKRRLDANKGIIAVKLLENSAADTTDKWFVEATREIPSPKEYFTQNFTQRVARILVNSFNKPPHGHDKVGASMVVVESESRIEKRGLTFKAIVDDLVKDLWKNVRSVFNRCEYKTQKTPWYYKNASFTSTTSSTSSTSSKSSTSSTITKTEADSSSTTSIGSDNIGIICVRERSSTTLDTTDPQFRRFCRDSYYQQLTCRDSIANASCKCDDECKRRLDERPCLPDCGRGNKSFPNSDDVYTRLCKNQWIGCNLGLCPRQIAGRAMMAFGFTVAPISVVLLIVFYFAFVKNQQTKASNKKNVLGKKEETKIDIKSAEVVGKKEAKRGKKGSKKVAKRGGKRK